MIARGLVIRRLPYGDSDLIVHALLENDQILHFFAPMARKSKRRFPHQFELSGLYEWEWARSPEMPGQLVRLQRADLVDWKPELSIHVESWARWAVVLEWISQHQEAPTSFVSLLKLRDALSASPQSLGFHEFFLNQMKQHGLSPELKNCLVCHQGVLETMAAHFHLDLGGVAHARCGSGIPLSAETLGLLRAWFEDALHSLEGLQDIVSTAELDRVSLPFLIRQLDRTLKSHSFLEQIQRPLSP